MSQKTTRKTRQQFESEKAVENGTKENEQKNGTKENEETSDETQEEDKQNSKESPVTDAKENGTEVPNDEEKDKIETEEERKEETIEAKVLPETNVEATVLNSEKEEEIELDLHVERNTEEVTEQTEIKETECKEKQDNSEEYLLAEDAVNENSVDNENVSTQVMVGNDTTRNIDFTLPPDSSMERSKFLNMSKDHSVGESIKYLSSRRSIRSIKGHFVTDGVNMYTLQKTEGVGYKRKNRDDTEERAKRIKTESPGVFSYLSKPFGKNDMSSSTPKLTGFKSNNFDNTNVSKISLNDTEKGQNKWCSVM